MDLFRKSPHLVSIAESRAVATPVASRSMPLTVDKHLLDYLRILVKRRWTAVTVLLLSLAVAAAHLYSAVPIYQTAVQILIEHETETTFSLQDSVAKDRETTDYYNTQYTILQSRTLAKRAIEASNAWKHPEIAGGKAAGPSGIIEGTKNTVLKIVGRLKKPNAQPVAAPEPSPSEPATATASVASRGKVSETPEQAAAIDEVLARLTIAPVKTSRLVDVKVSATDPKFAADMANALAHAYIDQNLEVRMSSSKETTDWLTQQLSEQRSRVEASENALQRYRESHDAVSLSDPKNVGGQNIVSQKLTDLNAMVTRAKADRIAREALYNQVQSSQGAALETIPSIMSNSYVQGLKSEVSRLQAQRARLSGDLLEGHPEMIKMKTAIDDAQAKLDHELTKQVDAIKNEFDAARRLEASLIAALEGQKNEVTQMSKTGINFSGLERDLNVNRQIFESLLERTREKGIASELKASDVRIVDAAQVPRSPIWPNRNETYLYASLLGLLLGVGLAFFVEYMDDRIKTPDELQAYLGLPCLGMIPAVGKETKGSKADDSQARATPLLGGRSAPQHFAEAFRSVRTNVILGAEDRAQTLVITSTGPGEGKTFVASNLALGLAMANRKVIIVDVDMRCPRVHEVFGVVQQPGLSELLAGKIELAQALRTVPGTNLWVLPSGGRTDNPAEQLASPQFAQLLSTLASRFEWVLLDSPPVAAVTDACIVANRASAVLFVVGAQKAHRAAALHAVEQLEAARATFLGGVLNGVHLRRDAFYYSSYYRPEYDKYFQSNERH